MKILAKLLRKTSSVTRRLARQLTEDKEWTALLQKWKRLDPEKQYRTNYPELGPESIVFDLGGYQGQWASDIYARYCCEIYLFEPHPVFVNNIRERFARNASIKVFPFGLGSKDEQLLLSTEADSSTVFGDGEGGVPIELVEAAAFIKEQQIEEIDLIKINIEGGEYALLDHLISSGLVKRIKNLQIQFHHFVPDAERLMEDLHRRLEDTHETTYFFRFFWENWRVKE